MNRGIMAAAMSAVLPGAGQLYNHHWIKGGIFLIAVMVISGAIRRRMLFEGSATTAVVVAVILLGVALWAVADAYLGAKQTS